MNTKKCNLSKSCVQLHLFLFPAACDNEREIDTTTFINCLKNKFGSNVLHQAAKEGDLHLVQFLHEHGENMVEKSENGENQIIQSILSAALNGHDSIVEYLIKFMKTDIKLPLENSTTTSPNLKGKAMSRIS